MMPDPAKKNLPFLTDYTDGSIRPHAWANETIMVAINMVYRRQGEILKKLDKLLEAKTGDSI